MSRLDRVLVAMITVVMLAGIWAGADLVFIEALGLFETEQAMWNWDRGRVTSVAIFGWGCAYIGGLRT